LYGPHLSMVAIFAYDLVFREREKKPVYFLAMTLCSQLTSNKTLHLQEQGMVRILSSLHEILR
jgi:hypothetical protein